MTNTWYFRSGTNVLVSFNMTAIDIGEKSYCCNMINGTSSDDYQTILTSIKAISGGIAYRYRTLEICRGLCKWDDTGESNWYNEYYG